MAQWRDYPANRTIRGMNNFTEGIVTNIEPAFIPDSAMTDGYGWDFNSYPALAVRGGKEAWGDAGGVTYGLFNYANLYLIRANGDTLQWNDNGTHWSNIGGTWSRTDWDATMFDINGPAIILTNGTDQPSYWNSASLTGILQMPKGRYLASDNLRVYTAGVSGTEDYIYYCAYLDAEDWLTPLDAGKVQYYTPQGGPVTALKTFNGNIWVFKQDACAVISNTGDARSAHRMDQISNFIGCVSFKTVKQVSDGMFWLGLKNVYMTTGAQPIPIGDPIQRYLKAIIPGTERECCAFVDGQNYYLCLSINSNRCDTCLVYSTVYKKWLPYSITMNGTRYGELFNNGDIGGAFTGDANGQIYKMNIGTTDAGTPIPFSMTSKPFDDGMPEARKALWRMHIQGKFPIGTAITISTSDRDEGENWLDLEMNPDMMALFLQNKDLIVPLNQGPLSNYYRYRISGTGQVQINSVQRYSRIKPVLH